MFPFPGLESPPKIAAKVAWGYSASPHHLTKSLDSVDVSFPPPERPRSLIAAWEENCKHLTHDFTPSRSTWK
jgi:hypothetical protein